MPESNKHILIAAIGSAAGAAAAATFAAAGWRVTGIAPSEKDESAGGHPCTLCNLMDRAETDKAIQGIEETVGPIDALFVSAHVSMGKPFLEVFPSQWKERLDTWLRGPVNLCYAVGKRMVSRQMGRILVLTPDFKNTVTDCTIEATASGSLHGFIKSFGAEVAASSVTVNGVYAGLPLDLEAIAQTCLYLVEEGDYVSAQLVSIKGKG